MGLISILIWLIADFIYVQLGQQSSHRCFDYLLLISQYIFGYGEQYLYLSIFPFIKNGYCEWYWHVFSGFFVCY